MSISSTQLGDPTSSMSSSNRPTHPRTRLKWTSLSHFPRMTCALILAIILCLSLTFYTPRARMIRYSLSCPCFGPSIALPSTLLVKWSTASLKYSRSRLWYLFDYIETHYVQGMQLLHEHHVAHRSVVSLSYVSSG
jgi:hypothetical protein